MAKYKFCIREVLSLDVELEAPTYQEALDKVRSDYKAERIVLTADNFESVEIESISSDASV